MARGHSAIWLALGAALRHGPAMAIRIHRRVFRNTALSVCVCLCLSIQVLIAGFSFGASTALAGDPVSLLAAAICASNAGTATRPDLPGRSVDRQNSCLSHCLGLLSAGKAAPFVRFEAPATVALANVEAPVTQAAAAVTPTDGLGARAPPAPAG